MSVRADVISEIVSTLEKVPENYYKIIIEMGAEIYLSFNDIEDTIDMLFSMVKNHYLNDEKMSNYVLEVIKQYESYK